MEVYPKKLSEVKGWYYSDNLRSFVRRFIKTKTVRLQDLFLIQNYVY